MNILPVSYNHNQPVKTAFTSCTRIYNPKSITKSDIFAGDKVRTTSNLFRQDEDWDFLMKYIFGNFIDKMRVKIYSLGCSDGSEPYTYALFLKDKTPESFYKKFTPIYACDIDPEMIKVAQSGKINLDRYDFCNMKKYIKYGNEYFRHIGTPIKIKNNIIQDEESYEIIPEIKNMVDFKKSDILTEIKKINDDGNSVVNIRNVLPYLSDTHVNEILTTLSERLKTGSMYVFGHFDNRIQNLRQKLHKLGFYSPDADRNFVQKK